MNTQITSAAEAQWGVSEEIKRSVNNICMVSDETAIGMNLLATKGEDVVDVISDLTEQIKRFAF